ncbi:MAG: GumC family protein [Armatimonadota bacterium]
MSLQTATEALSPQTEEINIRQILDIIRRRRAIFLQVFIVVLAAGVVASLLQKPLYQTEGELIIPQGSQSINVVDPKDPLSYVLSAGASDPLSTQIREMSSTGFLESARKQAGVSGRSDIQAPSVKIEADGPQSNIVGVTVTGGDPKEITRLCEAILTLFPKWMEQHQTKEVAAALDFVETQYKETEAKLRAAETSLASFRREKQIASLELEAAARQREYSDLQATMRGAQMNATATRAQIDELKAILQSEPTQLLEVTTRDNPRYADLQRQQSELQQRLSEQLALYKPGSRQITDLQKQLDYVAAQLESEPRELETTVRAPNASRSTIQAQITDLQAKLQSYRAEANLARSRFEQRQGELEGSGAWEVQLNRLTQDRDRLQSQFNMLSERRQTLQIRKNALAPVGRPLSQPSEPNSPISPNRKADIAMTLVLALLLAGGVVMLQEWLDDRINSPEDLERVTPLPALGHVPLLGSNDPVAVHAHRANSQFAEAYRLLRSNVGFASIDAPLSRLQVTSASKGEGKTVTAANLATALAMDGKRVILMDADLRRPAVHRVFNLPNTPGLTEALTGTKSVQEVIRPTEIENLRVVTSGAIPPNPAELLGSAAFDSVLERLEAEADIVVVDSPPCMPVTDPLILAGRMDGVLLVLRVGQTRRGAIRHVSDLLHRAHARILGVVYNRISTERGSSYYYQNYYYYHGDDYYGDDDTGHRRNGKRRKRSLPNRESELARRDD